MTELFHLFAASAALAASLAAISVWSHRKLWAKLAAVLATALFIPTIYLSYSDLLSRPKPASLEWWNRDASEATVVSAKLREGEAIYLWIEMADADEPRAYKLPWHQELAKQLYGAQREAEAMGTKVRMRSPFKDQTEEQEAVFYALPQPPLPSKHVDSASDQFFQHSSTRSRREGTGGS
jgi:methionine-rich copper-binding protein CopC